MIDQNHEGIAESKTQVRCAFLTKQNGVFVGQDDETLARELMGRGWFVEAIDWKTPSLKWNEYDIVVIRSPWDYYYFPKEFLATLEVIRASGCLLVQEYEVVRKNIDKRYLSAWIEAGYPVIPTQYFHPFDSVAFGQVKEMISASQQSWILKPTISAGSVNTFLLDAHSSANTWTEVRDSLQTHHVMLQPFLQSVQHQGEISLIFLGGRYHHTVLKTPAPGDFRVQVQHGGVYQRVEPDPWLVDASYSILTQSNEDTLYSRFDWVRGDDDVSPFPYLLMECEQIEPDLYLRFTAQGFQTYANLLVERFEIRKGFGRIPEKVVVD